MVPVLKPAMFAAAAPLISSPETPLGGQFPAIAPATHLASRRPPEIAPLDFLSIKYLQASFFAWWEYRSSEQWETTPKVQKAIEEAKALAEAGDL